MVSTAADACIAVALAGTLFFNLDTDAARSHVTLYLLLTLAPFAVVAPLLGPAVDRLARAPMRAIAATGWARAALALVIAAAPVPAVLLPASFLVLVFGRAYAVTKRASVPSVVTERTPLIAANALLSRAGTGAAAIGGLIATLTLHFSTAATVLHLGAVLHVAAALLAPAIVAATTRAAQAATMADDGARPTLRAPVLAMAGLRVAAGLLAFTTAFALREQDAPTVAYAFVAASVPIGSYTGTYLSPRLRRLYDDERAILGGCLAAGAVVVAAAAFGGIVGIALALPLVALASSVGRHTYDTIVQRGTTAANRNRVFAKCEVVLQMAWVSGALIPTAAAISAPLAPALAAVALGLAAVPISVRAASAPEPQPRTAAVPARAVA